MGMCTLFLNGAQDMKDLVVFILTSTRGVCRASESTALICEDLSNRTGFEVVT